MKQLSLCLVVSILLGAVCMGQPAIPLGQRVFTLVRFLDKNHYQPREWNDSTSSMLFDKWMDEIDGARLFYTQADRQQLEAYRLRLDDEIRNKKTDFFTLSISLFKTRLLQADSMISLILSKPIDFSKPEAATWNYRESPRNISETYKRWSLYYRLRVLDMIVDMHTPDSGLIPEAIPASFTKDEASVRDKLRKRDLGLYIKNRLQKPAGFTDDMALAYLNAVAWCYDPHTNYFDLTNKKEFEAATQAMEFSLGFNLEENEKGEKMISHIDPGGSAWKSGQLHVGDILVRLKRGDEDMLLADMDDRLIQEWLNGADQSAIDITVKTVSGEIRTVKLAKEMVTDEESVVKSYVLEAGKKIGYIHLPGFYSRETDAENLNYNGCANDLSKEIMKLKRDQVEGLILDLRSNGGGSMWEAIQLAGIFIDVGPVASIREKNEKPVILKDPNRGTIYDGPLMVLINAESASASEFFAAALQDHRRALIVGNTSYGKGSMQVVAVLDTSQALRTSQGTADREFVKFTTGKFYRVDGSTVQWSGVVPDISLPEYYVREPERERLEASALRPDTSRKAVYQPWPYLPVSSLAAQSRQRIEADGYYQLKNAYYQVLAREKEKPVMLQWLPYVQMENTRIRQNLAIKHMPLNSGFTVWENSFNQVTASKDELSKSFIEHIRYDRTVKEAIQIMLDWLKR